MARLVRGCYCPQEDFGYCESWMSSILMFKLGGANSHNYAKTSKKKKRKKKAEKHPFLNINVCIKADFNGTLLIVIQCLPFTY